MSSKLNQSLPATFIQKIGTRHFILATIFSVLYFIWMYYIVGLRNDHLIFMGFIASMIVVNKWTRQLIYGFIFFICFWIIYDSMRAFPNYLLNPVHILEPYTIEKWIFGLTHQGVIYTPNEFLQLNSNTFLDIISGLFYLTWMPVPMALGLYLLFKDKKLLLQFSAAFLFTNLVGFCLYYSYPAAPPWYFAKYGNIEFFNIPGDAAQLIKFDEWVGSPVFQNIYTKNSNVFAAIPSLHAAYPIVTWYYAKKKKISWLSTFLFIVILGIWFSAVYSFHHYLIDVLLGGACAIFTIIICEKWIFKSTFNELLEKYALFIQK